MPGVDGGGTKRDPAQQGKAGQDSANADQGVAGRSEAGQGSARADQSGAGRSEAGQGSARADQGGAGRSGTEQELASTEAGLVGGERVSVEIAGRRLSVSNLDKAMYPVFGFTKAQVIDYYVRIAPLMLPHIADRGVTLRRWPDGVTGESFFEKRCPSHRPEWLGTCRGPGDRRGGIEYCRLDSVAALAWTANLAALEIHAPMARCGDIDNPSMLVFDLDPGRPAGLAECARAALDIRDLLDAVGLVACTKTSGRKGMQVYVPLNAAHSHEQCADFAQAVAGLIERKRPGEVVSKMAKAARRGKVFVDWSQNSRHKTTIAPYSLRAEDRPSVSTPLAWDEVSDAADGEPLVFTAPEVLERAERLGDLFADTVSVTQELPALTAAG